MYFFYILLFLALKTVLGTQNLKLGAGINLNKFSVHIVS